MRTIAEQKTLLGMSVRQAEYNFTGIDADAGKIPAEAVGSVEGDSQLDCYVRMATTLGVRSRSARSINISSGSGRVGSQIAAPIVMRFSSVDVWIRDQADSTGSRGLSKTLIAKRYSPSRPTMPVGPARFRSHSAVPMYKRSRLSAVS